MISQTEMIKEKILLLIKSGVTSKTTIYKKISDETGLPRPTIRRVAGELRKQIYRKIKVLTDEDTLKRIQKRKTDGYDFLPKDIRYFWLKKIKKDFVKVKCAICKMPLGYVYQYYDGSIICRDCQFKFPESRKEKKR